MDEKSAEIFAKSMCSAPQLFRRAAKKDVQEHRLDHLSGGLGDFWKYMEEEVFKETPPVVF